MGLFDKLKASAIEAGKLAKQYSKESITLAEDNFGNEDWFKKAKDFGSKAKDVSKEISVEVSKIGNEIVSDISKTDFGKKVGVGSRKFVEIVSQLPILTLSSDIIKSKNGINELYDILKKDKNNPENYVFLAEAMRRVERDKKIYFGFKTVMNPTSIIFRESIKTAVSIGLDESDPTEIKLLKNAFYLCVSKLKIQPKDSITLHALARVYLLMGLNEDCIRFCKLAILADSRNKLPYITLARAYIAIEQYDNANKSANIAITYEKYYAYEILSQLVMLANNNDIQQKIEEYSLYRDKISKEDRKIYLGVSIDEVSVLETIGKEQLTKATNLIDKTKKYLDDLNSEEKKI